MNQTEKPQSGTRTLRPRARIIRTLGDELISSEIVALLELVKNSYDADATTVLIKFRGPLEIGTGTVFGFSVPASLMGLPVPSR